MHNPSCNINSIMKYPYAVLPFPSYDEVKPENPLRPLAVQGHEFIIHVS